MYEDNEGFLAIDYQSFIPILFELAKQQTATIESLQNDVETIKYDCCQNSHLKSASLTGTESVIVDKTALYQNIPNPFTINTQIKYYLADDVTNASIYIYNMIGTQLKSYKLQQKGAGSLIINGNEFKAGVYLYSLVVDNKEVDNKRMILTD